MSVIIVFGALIGALIGFVASSRRGFSPLVGLVGGFLLGPFAVFLFLVSSGDTGRRCPYCQEFVQPAAVVCKHCGRDLTPFVGGR